MRIFLTEFYTDGEVFNGEPIEAISWIHAEEIAEEYGLSVIGEWRGDFDDETGERIIDPNLN